MKKNVISKTQRKRKISIMIGVFFIVCSLSLFLLGGYILISNDSFQSKKNSFHNKDHNLTASEISSNYPESEDSPVVEEETATEESNQVEDGVQNISSDPSTNSSNYQYSSSNNLTIQNSGSYRLNGDYSCIYISTPGSVTLYLDNASIHCNDGPAIYAENSNTLSIHLSNYNSISANTNDSFDGAIFSNDDLVFSGSGSLSIQSNYDGIVSKDSLIFRGGNYSIESNDDGIRGRDNVAIVGGSYTIHSSRGDGIKSTNENDSNKGYITIDNGYFDITSYNDGIQAATNVKISGGEFHIKTTGNPIIVSSKGIKADHNVEIRGGDFQLNTLDDGIHANGNIYYSYANTTIRCRDDGMHADGYLEINNGSLSIDALEGIEATYIKINGGNITINASDDGINASMKSYSYDVVIEINGGYITINMGRGDTDAVDSNGFIYMNGGTLNINGEFPFDYEGGAQYSGGTIIVNGQVTYEMVNQFTFPHGGQNRP